MSSLGATELYEFLAYAFNRMTGYMAPGKSQPIGMDTPYEDREAAWRKWGEENRAAIRAFEYAAEQVWGRDE